MYFSETQSPPSLPLSISPSSLSPFLLPPPIFHPSLSPFLLPPSPPFSLPPSFSPSLPPPLLFSLSLHQIPSLVLGPFGCGKTRTLSECVKLLALFAPEMHILICTHSNGAANLYVERLHMEWNSELGGGGSEREGESKEVGWGGRTWGGMADLHTFQQYSQPLC